MKEVDNGFTGFQESATLIVMLQYSALPDKERSKLNMTNDMWTDPSIFYGAQQTEHDERHVDRSLDLLQNSGNQMLSRYSSVVSGASSETKIRNPAGQCCGEAVKARRSTRRQIQETMSVLQRDRSLALYKGIRPKGLDLSDEESRPRKGLRLYERRRPKRQRCVKTCFSQHC